MSFKVINCGDVLFELTLNSEKGCLCSAVFGPNSEQALLDNNGEFGAVSEIYIKNLNSGIPALHKEIAELNAQKQKLRESLKSMVAMIDCGDEHGYGSEWHVHATSALRETKD